MSHCLVSYYTTSFALVQNFVSSKVLLSDLQSVAWCQLEVFELTLFFLAHRHAFCTTISYSSQLLLRAWQAANALMHHVTANRVTYPSDNKQKCTINNGIVCSISALMLSHRIRYSQWFLLRDASQSALLPWQVVRPSVSLHCIVPGTHYAGLSNL